MIEEIEGIRLPAERVAVAKENILEKTHAGALAGESYEAAASAVESIEAVRDFRERLKGFPFGSFYDVFETITTINRAPISREEKDAQIHACVEDATGKASRFSPRVADLYLAILSEINAEPYETEFELTREKVKELISEGDLSILLSGSESWDMKLNRIETRLRGYLGGARALDRREGKEMEDDEIRKWREEKLKEFPTNPPERRNESRPGVDPMAAQEWRMCAGNLVNFSSYKRSFP